MVPPLQPPRDESERTTPLLPASGIDAESVFDLPWAVDETTLPPPPDPVLPPTFSAPSPRLDRAEEPPDEPRPAAPPVQAAVTALPAPISAGHLSGSALNDEPEAEPAPAGPADALPPMVAKGEWNPSDSGGTSGTAAAGPLGIQPQAPAPSLIQRLSRSPQPPAPAAAAPAPTSAPTAPGGPPPILDVPRAAPSGALAFSPEAGPPPSHQTVTAPAGPAPLGSAGQFSAIQPIAPGPDPRQTRGPAPIISEPRIGDGLLVAAAAATIAGVLWWAVVSLTQRQIPYVSILLGLLVGQATLVGGRRGSIGLGIVASVTTLLSLTAAQYFISRSLAISELHLDIPLWDGSSRFIEVIRTTIEDDPLTGGFILLAAVVAGVQAGLPGRRAAGPLGEMHVTRSPDRIL